MSGLSLSNRLQYITKESFTKGLKQTKHRQVLKQQKQQTLYSTKFEKRNYFIIVICAHTCTHTKFVFPINWG